MKALELMVSKIQPQGDASEDKEHRKPAPSGRTIHGVYTAILFMAKASFPGFTHSTFDRERVLNKLDTLVKQKKLVRGTWSERQVISVRLLIRLTSAFISHALIHGCLNFDSVTSRMLAIVLVAAGRRRAGDITRSRLYTNEVGMTWSDIELKLVGGSDYQHLRCKVTVRFAKGKKDKRNDDEVFYIQPLNKPEQNSACPVALMLIHALRHGLVDASTVQELLGKTIQRRDRRVQWLQPQYPVIPALNEPNDNETYYFAPLIRLGENSACPIALMLSHTLWHVLINVTSLPELLQRTAERRDRQVRWLKPQLPLVPTLNRQDRVLLDTSARSCQVWDTLRRAGILSGVLVPLRTHSIREGGLMETAQLSKKKFNGAATTAIAQALGQPVTAYTNGQTRKSIGGIAESLYNARTTLEREDPFALSVTNQPLESKRLTPDAVTQYCKEYVYVCDGPVQHALLRRQGRNRMHDDAINAHREHEKNDPLLLDEDGFDDLIVDDDALQQLESQLIVSDSDDEEEASTIPSEQEEALGLHVASSAMLRLPTLEFIDHASRFNVVKNSHFQLVKNDPEKRKERSVSGNSRDEPTPFIYHCKKTPGCTYTSDKYQIMKLHEDAYCTEKLLASKGMTKEDRRTPCPSGSCNQILRNPGEAQRHQEEMHDWNPQACPQGCNPEKLYPSKRALNNHDREIHRSGWVPMTCPLTKQTDEAGLFKCHSETLFTNRSGLKDHIRDYHQISKAEQERMDILPPKPANLKSKQE